MDKLYKDIHVIKTSFDLEGYVHSKSLNTTPFEVEDEIFVARQIKGAITIEANRLSFYEGSEKSIVILPREAGLKIIID